MDNTEKILSAIYTAIEEVNRELKEDRRIEMSRESALFGDGSPLDSFALVNLIVSIEQQLEDLFGVALTLADDRAVSQERSPFLTVGSFAEYIGFCLKAELDD